jgi:hypothetical protein
MPNTVIAVLSSGESGNTPSLGVLANGELALNYADSVLYFKTTSNSLGSIRTTEPSGLDGELQFNDSGNFGSDANLSFDKTTGVFSTSNVTSESIATNTYIQFSDGTKQYTANAGEGGGSSSSTVITFNVAPPETGNSVGDIWIDANTGIKFEYFEDSDSSQWIEFGSLGYEDTPLNLSNVGSSIVSSVSNTYDLGSDVRSWRDLYISGGISGNVTPLISNTFNLGSPTYTWKNIYVSGEVTGNLIPSANVTYDLGTSSNRWRDLYLSGTTLNLGGLKMSILDSSTFALIPEITSNVPDPKAFIYTATGAMTVVDTTSGNVAPSVLSNIAITTSDTMMTLSSNVTSNVSIRPGKNYLSVGPLTIASNVEITIEDGGEWTIV